MYKEMIAFNMIENKIEEIQFKKIVNDVYSYDSNYYFYDRSENIMIKINKENIPYYI